MNVRAIGMKLAMAPLVLLAACSSGSDDATAPSANTTATATTETPATTPEPAPAPAGATFASLKGDAANGKLVYAKCAACHSVNAGENRLGPSLHGVFGREAGKAPNYNYSPANKNSHYVWTGEHLFTYLENPRQAMPGNKMAFAGLADAQQRADLIAYLETLK